MGSGRGAVANFLPSVEYLQISCSKRDIENVGRGKIPLAIGVAMLHVPWENFF